MVCYERNVDVGCCERQGLAQLLRRIIALNRNRRSCFGVVLFQQEAAEFYCRKLTRLYKGGDRLHIREHIERSFRDQRGKIEFEAEAECQFFYQLEEDGFEIIKWDLQDDVYEELFEAVDFADDYLVAKAVVAAAVKVSFYGHFQKWDSEDREYLPMGSNGISVEEEITIDLLIKFSGADPGRAQVDGVEVLPMRHYLYLGEIEPDWMQNPENFED